MIKANELRVGNLIQYNEGGQCKVIGIHEFGIDVEFPEETTYIEYDQFSPIPLTEEWLLKFGFQRHDEGSVSVQFSYGTNPVTQDYLIYLKWIKEDYQQNGFPFYQNGHFKIKTVHQLQNLYYSLTGEEL